MELDLLLQEVSLVNDLDRALLLLMPQHDFIVVYNLSDVSFIQILVPLHSFLGVVTCLHYIADWETLVKVVVHPYNWVLPIKLGSFL